MSGARDAMDAEGRMGAESRMGTESRMAAESRRLEEDERREQNWKRWGPYLSGRQWGTVREDYSPDGRCWDYFPHDHARSRAYRWGEDGLLGIMDREGRLCFALALWNGRDAILKERLFGLSGPEGNHGEDVKEAYFYLDSTPTHSYMKALYKYPQAEFPYGRLVAENRSRGLEDREFELEDTGVFDQGRYFDVFVEYAKAAPDDLLVRITVANRGPDAATLHLLPTLWFRNTWSWGRTGEGYWPRPSIVAVDARASAADGAGARIGVGASAVANAGPALEARHETLGRFRLEAEPPASRAEPSPELLFTENETNAERLFATGNASPYVKDAFHEYVVRGRREAINPAAIGTKAALRYRLDVPPGEERVVRLRLTAQDGTASASSANGGGGAFGPAFERTFSDRIREADEFYAARFPSNLGPAERAVTRQAFAGVLWCRQFYHYVVQDWLDGDPSQPPPPESRRQGRNHGWTHLYNRDVLSMPDDWEYPWYAAWDLAFHMITFAQIDPAFAKSQLVLMLREWYTHPNGQLPAYEFAFSDVNPPVHAWACWRVYKMTGPRGGRDRLFLERVFQKLLMSFTWWVNRKDQEGNHVFEGGFLGLDNIGVFDRSKPLPTGGHLEQADGTAWMAFFCSTMLSMALELASQDPAYEDVASKFFEHFVAISDAINTLGGHGLWDEEDGFYYDQLHVDDRHMLLRVRSMVGIIPLFACGVLDQRVIERLPGFAKRMQWFLDNRKDLARHISYLESGADDDSALRLLAIPSRERLERMLRYVLDPAEFLSDHGVRSLSRVHREHPYTLRVDGQEYRVDYAPAESRTGMFGGNSNWRGPVWFPLNYLLIEALERYHHFYGDSFQVEFPTGSGRRVTLAVVARELACSLAGIFLPDGSGRRPCNGDDPRFASDPHWKDLVLFHEYFDGDTARGLGASHQTGWTALVARWMEDLARRRLATSGERFEAGPAPQRAPRT